MEACNIMFRNPLPLCYVAKARFPHLMNTLFYYLHVELQPRPQGAFPALPTFRGRVGTNEVGGACHLRRKEKDWLKQLDLRCPFNRLTCSSAY